MANGEMPDFFVRAEIPQGRNRKSVWVTMGAAWRVRDGHIALRINATPLHWDGNCLLVESKENEA